MKTFKLKHLQDIDSGKIIERKLNEDFSEIPVKYITELKAGDYIRSCGVLNNSCMLKKMCGDGLMLLITLKDLLNMQ